MNGQVKTQEPSECVQSAKVPTGIKTERGSLKKTVFICKTCGKGFTSKKACQSRVPVYCSRKCCGEGNKGNHYAGRKKGSTPWNKGIQMWTDRAHPRGTLGMKFPNRKPLTDEQRKRVSDSHRGLKYPSRSGENHHFWRGGITPENEKWRKSAEYRNWRLSVFERDAYTCLDCHKQGGYLHAHHKEKFSDYPELRFDSQNGMTLCMDCHAKRHGLVFSIIAKNRCPDCGKRIKVGARYCLPCRMRHTQENRKRCIGCGAVIQNVSERCRSCAAKINSKKTGNLMAHWRRGKCNTRSSIYQSASLF